MSAAKGHTISNDEAATYLQRLLMFFRKRGFGDSADDLAQETIVRMLANPPKGTTTQDTVRWIFGIANNVANEAWKVQRRAQKMDSLDADRELLPDIHAEEVTESWEAAKDRDQLLSCLNNKEKSILYRFYLGDKKVLAAQLGITRSGLGVKVLRILRKLPRFNKHAETNQPRGT